MKITEYNKTYEQPASGSYRRAVNMFDWVQSIIVAVTVLFLAFTFVFRPVQVVGDSMLPTLQDGNWLFVSAFNETPEYGQIVIVTQPNKTASGEPIVKRVIAVGGQTVDIDFDSGAVFVDGVQLDEPYIKELTHNSFDVSFPLTVPDGFLFVMGDNRNNSLDSRSSRVGLIDRRYILGSVMFRAYPFGKIGA